MHPIIALWATPRSASTAFERMMIERGDHVVFDEPFSATYYFSDQRLSQRFDEVLSANRWRDVLAELHRAAESRRVFIKDMATHALPYLTDGDLATMSHSFLIRDPRRAIGSLVRRWPDATDDETGYRAQHELFERVRRLTGTVPPVIDAEGLCRSPGQVVRSWCVAVGLPFVEEALRWEPGMQPQWRLWRDWYTEVAKSTGFRPPDGGEPPPIEDRRVAALVEDALASYDDLASYALTSD